MLIVGGSFDLSHEKQTTKVEIISPGTGRKIDHCLIQPLPVGRSGHNINWPLGTGQLPIVCGGGQQTWREQDTTTLKSCIMLQSDGSWITSRNLKNQRLRIL